MELLNQLRALHYLVGVLTNQQRDLFCGQCTAWDNTLNNACEALKQLDGEHAAELRNLASGVAALLADTRIRLAGLVNVAHPTGQKKAGNCKLPEGVCFVKVSRSLMEKV